jgi:hypothetical protein
VAPTTEAAIAMLPLILLPIITLGGGIYPPTQMPQAVQAITKAIPSRWAFESNLVREALKHADTPEAPGVKSGTDLAEDTFPKADHRSSLGKTLGVLGAMLVFWVTLVLGVLKKRDVQ